MFKVSLIEVFLLIFVGMYINDILLFMNEQRYEETIFKAIIVIAIVLLIFAR